MDSGVEYLFKKPSPPKDYPPSYERIWARNAETLVKLVGRENALIVVPDYPDDYTEVWGRPHALWDGSKDNIERTLENIVYYFDKYREKYRLLIPIQGHHDEPESIRKSLKLLYKHGIIQEHDYFAVAPTCVTRKVDVIEKMLRITRSYLASKKIHVFGVTLIALKRIASMIDSFDSSVADTRRRKWWRYLNARDDKDFFTKYVEKINSIIAKSTSSLLLS